MNTRNRRLESNRRSQGFTLIEIMAVVLIMGLLAGIVGTAVFGQVNRGRVTTTKVQLKNLESNLTMYQVDNGRFPSTEQGLEALVRPPSGGPAPQNYPPGGYLQGGTVPLDAWGNPYEYRFPGENNPEGFDLWSWGADGAPGGDGTDADIGNWSSETG